ncbi:hypothetical protein KI387_037058 [Taxus chinensis]|uniref:Uncharacterized protein n=1 Tax=Taxus chinensis TaxID=29808 RepID=A0AA38FRW2_TAXCH|nr:hypothetical protein KI387_037058 [Taxus chinensis]
MYPFEPDQLVGARTMEERARTRTRRSPEDRAPIFTRRYLVRQLLKHGLIDERRGGSYMPEDRLLARSHENAFLSVNRYLRQDEPADSKSSFDRQVRSSSSHRKRKFDTSSSYAKGESYFTRKRVIQNKQELMQKNSRCHTDGFAAPFPISSVREDAKNVNFNQTSCLSGNGDDSELEEGELTPSTRGSSPSLSLSSSQPETENNGSVFPIEYRDNSCAINLTPTSKKRMKCSIDYSPSQFKKRKRRSSTESHIIVVCDQGSDRQQHNFLDNVKIASLLENTNTREDHQENDVRKRGLMLSNGLDLVSGKAGSEFDADVRSIDGKFNTISAPVKFRCPAANEWKPLQQEGDLREDKSIVHMKDAQGSNSGDESEMARLSLQGDQIDQSKQRQNLSAYSDLTSQVDLSSCIQHANIVGGNCLGFNCKRVDGSKGPVGALSATDKEMEKVRDMGNSKDCGSLSKEDAMQGKIAEVITYVEENVSVPNKEPGLQVSNVDSLYSEAVSNRVVLPVHNCLPFDGNENVNSPGSVNSLISLTGLSFGLGISESGPCKTEKVKGVTDHLGVHTSDLPLKHVHPHIDLVPFQKFISTVSECGLQGDDIGEKRELGKPRCTEATCVSSLVPMTTAVANSTVFLDDLDTILEAKRVDFTRVTLNSDSLMAKLNVQQIDDMRCSTESNISTALKDDYLHGKTPSIVELFGSYPTDLFDFHERPCKKLKSGHDANLKINLTQWSCTPNSHFPEARKQKCPISTIRSDVHQQSRSCSQVFKQKKWGSSLDTGHPQFPRSPLFQTYKVVPSLLPWKRPASVASHSRRINKKLQCFQTTQAFYSRSVNRFTLSGGSNLKWTKSIDKCTEKHNAEATIKADAVEKWKGEGKDDVAGDVGGKEQAKMLVACKAAQYLKLNAHK